ncbi:sensor histidine kinase [Mycolicibacterium rutilum]|uniref:sensor histidine kinase n=1 Tax=Mycolicibacterium rutilum TaxID=370526 RepID=UPI000B2BB642|nr:ATP-binding protein [Mycolicibacterium rutilum]
MRLTRESELFVLAATDFAHFMKAQFPIAVHLIGGHVLGGMRQQQLLSQRLRLLGLGAITAGLTHQLNNPAAAIDRATAELCDSVTAIRKHVDDLAAAQTGPEAIAIVHMVQQAVRDTGAGTETPMPRASLDIADREDAVCALVEQRGLRDGPEFAAVFAESALEIEWLTILLARIAERSAPDRCTTHQQHALDWLRCLIRTDACISEVTNSSRRISALLTSAERYSQMDRGDYQLADVHDLLDSTLTVCAPQMQRASITVRRQWDLSLPKIHCYAGDLNQVWTNLFDNAVDAMGMSGTLTVRTALADDDRVAVTIADDGDGIGDDIIEHIFAPFFTTKTAERNAGLGLDLVWRIVQRHRGSVSVTSTPGRTEFTVTLPLQAPAPEIPLSCHRTAH